MHIDFLEFVAFGQKPDNKTNHKKTQIPAAISLLWYKTEVFVTH